jgi:hypothetical protein
MLNLELVCIMRREQGGELLGSTSTGNMATLQHEGKDLSHI